MRKVNAILHTLHNESFDDLITTGIYTITSKVNNKIYVGSAGVTEGVSKAHLGFWNRWRSHIHELLSNVHRNKHLQNHVNKYGIIDLKFEILLQCDSEYCGSNELYWIRALDTVNNGFNLCYNANFTYGVNHPKYINLDEKEIVKLYLNGECASDIAKKFNISVTPIKRILYKNNITLNNHLRKDDFYAIYNEYINNYCFTTELSKKYNLCNSTLVRTFKRLNLPLKKEMILRDLNVIYSRYLSGESIQLDIAPEYKVHYSTINRELIKNNFKTKLYGN